MYATKLIDAARRRAEIDSDYALATRLAELEAVGGQGAAPRKALSRWRAGEIKPSGAAVIALAKLAGIDPGEALANVEADHAESDAVESAWCRLLRDARRGRGKR